MSLPFLYPCCYSLKVEQNIEDIKNLVWRKRLMGTPVELPQKIQAKIDTYTQLLNSLSVMLDVLQTHGTKPESKQSA